MIAPLILALSGHRLVWEPPDLRAAAAMVWRGAKLRPEAAPVTPISDVALCARLARALGRAPETPVYAARVGTRYVVIPAAPGELADEMTVLDANFRIGRKRMGADSMAARNRP